jgi:cytochrome d ubiquinol oxidase subunit I
VKFAAFEALYEGKDSAGLTLFGILKDSERKIGSKNTKEFAFRVAIPDLLSILTGGGNDYFVPGIEDYINGGSREHPQMPVAEKMERGRYARDVLLDYKRARMTGDREQVETIKGIFTDPDFIENNFKYFGYSFLKSPEDAIPDVPVAFYSFHLMVILGFFFIIVCSLAIFMLFRGTLERYRWFLWIMVISIPLVYISSESGWVLAEMGRQPWIIQDMMPVSAAVTRISAGSVLTTFILFAVLFSALLAAEVSIMMRQIRNGPKH